MTVRQSQRLSETQRMSVPSASKAFASDPPPRASTVSAINVSSSGLKALARRPLMEELKPSAPCAGRCLGHSSTMSTGLSNCTHLDRALLVEL